MNIYDFYFPGNHTSDRFEDYLHTYIVPLLNKSNSFYYWNTVLSGLHGDRQYFHLHIVWNHGKKIEYQMELIKVIKLYIDIFNSGSILWNDSENSGFIGEKNNE